METNKCTTLEMVRLDAGSTPSHGKNLQTHAIHSKLAARFGWIRLVKLVKCRVRLGADSAFPTIMS